MSETHSKSEILKGGSFIIQESSKESTFIPEEMNEDQIMIKEMILDFIEQYIAPNRKKIENQEPGLSVELMEKAGELGILGAHMPEAFGGMGLETNSNTIIGECLGRMACGFTVSIAAHTGIGMLPILYFGTEEQKSKYLPLLISGASKAAYCLTEPGSGSDALGAKSRADLSEDGKHYILNGQKIWITNAGFADIFIVFAKIDGDKFTGFIVEKGDPGFTFGEEEDKLGIHGSSTRQIYFENVKVPVENVLGEIGKGHRIAFSALNIGRFKLAAMTVGGAKLSITNSIKYANERNQFKVPISSFGAIQHKLAQQTIYNFAIESALYRTSKLLKDKKEALMEGGMGFGQATLESAKEFAIECAMLKVAGSEMVDYVVDESVQIHGGIGYSEELDVAQAYRDARINRIFEGTNEINRLLTVNMLLKSAMKGEIDIVGPAWAVQKELSSMPGFEKFEGPYADERKAIKDFKKTILMVAGGAAKMQMDGHLDLKHEQEIVMNTADMMIDTFLAESLLLRVEKLREMDSKPQAQERYDDMMKVFFHDANSRITKNATDALASFAEGDLLRTFLMGVKRFSKYPPQNVKNKRRAIAKQLIEANEYCF